MKKIAAVSLAAGIAAGLTGTPVHATSPRHVVTNPRLLGLGADAFPNMIQGTLTLTVDKTITAINTDAPLDDKNRGELFQSLGSYGSLNEQLLLHASQWKGHLVLLFASAFPSSNAAQRAFLTDVGNLKQICDGVQVAPSAQEASCSYSMGSNTAGATPSATGIVVSVVGSAEFVATSFIEANDHATADQLALAQTLAANNASSIAHNETLHLQHVLSLTSASTETIAPAPPAVNPHPAPIAKPRPLPIVKRAPAVAPTFTVRAWVTPSSMSYDAYPTLYVESAPGASCAASVVYSTGRSPVSFNGSPQTLPAGGTASWSWHEETKGTGGMATVDCTYHGQDHTAGASFTVQ